MGGPFEDLFKNLYGVPPVAPARRDLVEALSRIRQSGSVARPGNLVPVVPPHLLHAASVPKPTPPADPGIEQMRSLVRGLLSKKVAVTDGRVLPGIDDLAVMEGRRIRAAFVYSDLHGFTKLVATQPTNKSFIFLHTFVDVATRLTKHYKGEVVDVAGDRVLSVFHRPMGDLSNEPVEDAVTFALWLQTVFNKVIAPAFTGGGLGQLSLGIGIDYGEAVIGCVGIRNNKRIVFFSDAVNKAAKLQEIAGAGETVLSSSANLRKPYYLSGETWRPRPERLMSTEIILRITQQFASELPPKPR